MEKCKMSDVTKIPPDDGFDDAGDEGQQFLRIIRGLKIAFTNDSVWVDGNDEKLPADLELVAVQTCRVLQKWIDQAPDHDATRFLAPGEHVDVEQLNEACPRSEWSEDLNGKPRGPWQLQSVVYLVDLTTMQKYTFPTGTVGGGIAIGELKDAVKLMRKFRGPSVYPVIALSNAFMNTRFGGRQRPALKILRWIAFGPEGTALPPTSPSLLPSSQPEYPAEAAAAPDQAKTKAKTAKVKDKAKDAGASVVSDLSLHEELDDDIPF
jgi:hypothetical protein